MKTDNKTIRAQPSPRRTPRATTQVNTKGMANVNKKARRAMAWCSVAGRFSEISTPGLDDIADRRNPDGDDGIPDRERLLLW
jgi:hypothetical protein